MTAKTKISIRNLYKIFGANPDMGLELAQNGMSKSEMMDQYGHVIGLKNINIDMREGEITVIMGLSGSGKSTLIRHLNLLIRPTAGEVLVNGEDVTKYSEDELRNLRQNHMSMVFQKFALLPHRTVLENAGLSLRVRGAATAVADKEARKWLDRVGLSGFEQSYPHQLSGGMQQRVGIARALTSNSDIMLMDEAFSALDPLIRSDMQDLLLELQTDLHKTIVFITHDLDESLKLADHLVILNDGHIVQQGEPQHILLNPADNYIENFVGGINRARVLRVRSVMDAINVTPSGTSGEVDQDDNLESIILRSQGDISKSYKVLKDGQPVGILRMSDLLKALVPGMVSKADINALGGNNHE